MAQISATELQRLRYYQGQMLRSRDFRDQLSIEAQLRWWHNRAIHTTFGIANGLKVKGKNEAGKLRGVTVHPGIAYDCLGRELLLNYSADIQLPGDVSQDIKKIVLMMRYKETTQFPEKEHLSQVCGPDQCLPLQEGPDFLWKPFGECKVTDGVPLAIVNNCEGEFSLNENFTAPLSRPFARPRIATGATIPGNTSWEPWEIQMQRGDPIHIGFQVRIDTSAAGFTEGPSYFAWMQGKLANQGNKKNSFLMRFEHINEPTIKGFVFRLWEPLFVRSDYRTESSEPMNISQLRGFSVSWLGIQPWQGKERQEE